MSHHTNSARTMILDNDMSFATSAAGASAIASAGQRLVADLVLDLGAGTLDPDLYLVVQVSETFAAPGGTSVGFRVVADASSSALNGGDFSASQTITSATMFAVSGLTAGRTLLCTRISDTGARLPRYIGLVQTTTPSSITAGKIRAFFVSDPAAARAYADNIA